MAVPPSPSGIYRPAPLPEKEPRQARRLPLRRKDLLLLALVLLATVALLALSRILPQPPAAPTGGALPAGVAATAAATAAAAVTPAAETPPSASADSTRQEPANAVPPTLVPAQNYLSIRIGRVLYDPIPLLEDKELEIAQPDGRRNVVALTPDSIVMKESNCENQDCVQQGAVTGENRDRRVLFNQIICLPNQVVLSFLSPAEAEAQWEQAYPSAAKPAP